MGIDLKIAASQTTLDSFEKQKFGFYGTADSYLTSMSEFIVQKITDRHPDPTKRIFCLTEATILERDPQTYSVSNATFLIQLQGN